MWALQVSCSGLFISRKRDRQASPVDRLVKAAFEIYKGRVGTPVDQRGVASFDYHDRLVQPPNCRLANEQQNRSGFGQ